MNVSYIRQFPVCHIPQFPTGQLPALPLWISNCNTTRKMCDLTVAHRCATLVVMVSVNIRQLRDTRRLKAWLRSGKTVELRERDRVIGHIVPENKEKPPVEWPDFEARRKKIFGDRILPGADIVIEERGRY